LRARDADTQGSKINATVTIAVSPERREEAIEVLRSLLGPVRAARGCLGCWSRQDLEDPDRITFESLWATRADLTSYIRSGDYLRVLALMELSCERPRVRFYGLSDSGGMDVVEAIRGQRPTGER
jgi:quinol monooxygenase YgiN